jgi:hypothetical protein
VKKEIQWLMFVLTKTGLCGTRFEDKFCLEMKRMWNAPVCALLLAQAKAHFSPH